MNSDTSPNETHFCSFQLRGIVKTQRPDHSDRSRVHASVVMMLKPIPQPTRHLLMSHSPKTSPGRNQKVITRSGFHYHAERSHWLHFKEKKKKVNDALLCLLRVSVCSLSGQRMLLSMLNVFICPPLPDDYGNFFTCVLVPVISSLNHKLTHWDSRNLFVAAGSINMVSSRLKLVLNMHLSLAAATRGE